VTAPDSGLSTPGGPAGPADSAAAPPGRRGGRAATWLPPLGLFVLMIGLWYLFSYVVLNPDRRFLVPPPHEVIRASFVDSTTRANLFRALWLSTKVTFIGLVIAIVIGMATAIVMSQARWIERSVWPWAVVLQTIPTLAMVPLIGLWFGFGYASRIIVCVLITLFPVISSTLFGLQSAEVGLHDLFDLQHASRLTRLVKLELPAGLPAILTGFQVAATLAVVGAVVGDFFFKQGQAGIGELIDVYRARVETAPLFGAVILASLLGVITFWFFGFLKDVVTGSWHGSGKR
jgi:NitT/TauT family transport system permease protein